MGRNPPKRPRIDPNASKSALAILGQNATETTSERLPERLNTKGGGR